MRLIFYAPYGAIVKDGAAKGSPLKSQESRFLIPNKTHWKAEPLVAVVPAEETVIGVQEAVPRGDETWIVLSGTPKDCIDTLTGERTIVATVTLREGVKTAAVI